ncbi:MAG TPA: RNA polymerase sigma factor [Candidatus Sulfomarinibacteraceae bacterium]|nr:RNA polymerase sigma factor [Candidatus Sulfomarinibacteraceae bacterium]
MEHSGIVQSDAANPEEAGVALLEADLIRRARRDDDAAWMELVRRHQEPVFRLAYLTLGSGGTAADAEDVAQETFVRAYLKLEQFEDGRPLRPWLLAIAANLARNRRRSHGRYWAALRRWWQRVGELSAVEPAPADHGAMYERWQADRLWQAVQRLSPDHQQAVYLRYFLDLSEEEMAATLDVAPGTVKSRLYRARQALRAVIEAEFLELYEEWSGDDRRK